MNLQSVSKAIAGALTAALTAYLIKYDIILDAGVSEALTVLLAAVIGFVGVYVSPKNRGDMNVVVGIVIVVLGLLVAKAFGII